MTTGLCCAVLCCAVLCCAVLCCAVLCCAVLCCAVLCCAVLCFAMLCYAVRCYPMLCCDMPCYAPWAARYYTGLLIEPTPKGVVFSFLPCCAICYAMQGLLQQISRRHDPRRGESNMDPRAPPNSSNSGPRALQLHPGHCLAQWTVSSKAGVQGGCWPLGCGLHEVW